ncbi:BTB/POZ domain-containing protein At3g49900 isoform X2 [Cajanus cajan]|nr:BTB/POZ domain-containing protein At3g49900 isoform X2 [Cajanus cajan]
MSAWNQLGAVETIYEEECEFSSTSSSPSPSFSSSPPSLHSRVKAWSLRIGRETDILIRVQGICFRLHKDRVASQSSYLKRHLTETSHLTLSPPLNITPEAFAAVAEFCYNGKVQMTPGNVAAIRTAAELLGMTAEDGLSHVAETRFREVVGTNKECASTVLRSCLALLPEAETTASLVSRCIEALVYVDGVRSLNDVMEMQPRDFQTVAESMGRRWEDHDVLYKIVDMYLKEKKIEKVKEEERSGICNSIECSKLSSETLIECVQNPRMALRLVVRAVVVEHLNTRHSMALASAQRERRQRRRRSMTLGEFLHRDAALSERAKLRTTMDCTNGRIGRVEEEVRCMKRVLRECEEKEALRSESFHFVAVEKGGGVKKGERWSASFDGGMRRSSFSVDVPKMSATFGQRFMSGLKNAFRMPNSATT